ncbi:hypothetical protein IKL64_04430 [bacterium]|nr:hypothetical protein [bacterium]
MEITLKKGAEVDLVSKLREITNMCRVSRLSDMMYDFFDNMSNDNPVNYIGELNRNDVMH